MISAHPLPKIRQKKVAWLGAVHKSVSGQRGGGWGGLEMLTLADKGGGGGQANAEIG